MASRAWGRAEARRLFRFVLAATGVAWVAGAAAVAAPIAWSGEGLAEWRALAPLAAVGSALLWVWPAAYYPWEFAGRRG